MPTCSSTTVRSRSRAAFALRARILVDDRATAPPPGVVETVNMTAVLDARPEYEELIAASDPVPRIARSGTDQLLWYTGGTTGVPKGVLWEQQTLLTFELAYGAALLGTDLPATPAELAGAAAERAAVGRQLVGLVTTPLAHATAANQLHLTLAHGGTLVMLPAGRVDGDEICRTVERERVRLLSVVGDVVLRRVVGALDRAAGCRCPA